MSISSMGGTSAGSGTNPLLAAMLARLQQAEQAQQSASASGLTSATSAPPASDGCAATNASGDLTALSDQVVGMLVMMQGQGQGQDGSTASAQGASAASPADPVQQAFAGIDTDGDGAISQSEMESFIENQGGTAGQADALYQGLGGSGSTGISQTNFASAAQAGGTDGTTGAHGHHHHHHHGGSETSVMDPNQLFSAIDSNDDGGISSSELSSALTPAATAASPSASSSSTSSNDLFSAIDSDGSGTISQNELSTYLTSLQQQMQSDQGTLSAFATLANQSYNAGLSLFAANASEGISA